MKVIDSIDIETAAALARVTGAHTTKRMRRVIAEQEQAEQLEQRKQAAARMRVIAAQRGEHR
jgi:hypothetical protein